jgi:hypothetical protein
MSLDAQQSQWLHQFTGGAVPLPFGPARPGEPDPMHDEMARLRLQLELAQAREWAEEQALKTVLLAKAFQVIDEQRDLMRKQFDLQVQTYRDPDAEDEAILDDAGQPTGKTKKKSALKTQDVRDKAGRQERAYDASESTQLASAARGRVDKSLTATDATKAMAVVVGQKDMLAAEKTLRSRIDEKRRAIVQVSEPLFSDEEIMNELYTPLVRDLVLPETFVPDKYSATAKMIEGSNDYYIKECKAKGAPMATGAAAFVKGSIELGASITGTVLGAMAPVKAGQEAMASSGALSKEWAARATDITNGIAATLSAGVTAVDLGIDSVRNRSFSTSGMKTVLDGIATAVGKIVAGSTGDMALGLTITDSIAGASAMATIGAEVAVWKKKGGDFPLERVISLVGECVSKGLSVGSDQTSDTKEDASGNEVKTLESTRFAQASQTATTLFETAAKAASGKLLTQVKAGNWNAVYDFIKDTAVEVGKQLPGQITLNETYNTLDDYDKQHLMLKVSETAADGVEKGGVALGDLLGEIPLNGPRTPQQQRQDAIDKLFAEKQRALAQQTEELGQIEAMMDKEREDYRKSLVCLGSTEPSDADFKSIAKLVAQLEQDRKIWDGLAALFGGGIGAAGGMAVAMNVAAEVAPALKAAGQLVKYCINLKAAAVRCEAWLDWREGRKDAESAVSPYATSIDNFCRNQGQQFTHYSIQAASNAIQALLACGEMSPLAPAFKAAGGAVAASAAAEDLIYKFYKQVALRKAWQQTKKSLDPKNRGNRKMALLVRQINPTLAKYTIAYGALVEESPVAITACNRIGIDRETLARSSDKVSDLKDYLELLYPDDGSVLGVLDVTPGGIKVPPPALSAKAWALSYLAWTEKLALATDNPPAIVAHLGLVEALLAQADRDDDDTDRLLASLATLQAAFLSFEPETAYGNPIPAVREVALTYADLAEARAMSVQMEAGAAVM